MAVTAPPSGAVLVCDVDDNTRCYARVTDADMLAELEQSECVGRSVDLMTNEKNVNEVARWT